MTCHVIHEVREGTVTAGAGAKEPRTHRAKYPKIPTPRTHRAKYPKIPTHTVCEIYYPKIPISESHTQKKLLWPKKKGTCHVCPRCSSSLTTGKPWPGCGQAALRCTSDMPERRDEREIERMNWRSQGRRVYAQARRLSIHTLATEGAELSQQTRARLTLEGGETREGVGGRGRGCASRGEEATVRVTEDRPGATPAIPPRAAPLPESRPERSHTFFDQITHMKKYSPGYHPPSALGFALRRSRGRVIIRGAMKK